MASSIGPIGDSEFRTSCGLGSSWPNRLAQHGMSFYLEMQVGRLTNRLSVSLEVYSGLNAFQFLRVKFVKSFAPHSETEPE